ncbi:MULTISPECIES: LysE family translocator [Alphaproteobacteria]|uniref:Lysine transporter LysE n=2 Tax=Alphaproteobacteria TaxID=28211 RepID=A0A512HE10_9HYPH|nr:MULTISPECIES: LysE family translocator [Alphaproteobacteria]GEO83689.1 lysine transporter LysE [Ciceribacter naphthalenivorans]GLR24159.1 lysine transporter LysE [Ciceribacter naphthalenivorans]GLT07015.1 lysine transporter LysE [Sphingomonas psychrolutea]
MTPATLLAYSGALFVAAVIPGPGMTAIVARALGSGFRPTFFMGLGLILGDLCYLTAVIFGLALVAQTLTTPFAIIKYLGVLYLVYIAWKLWTTGLIAQNIEAKRSTHVGLSFLSGLLVTLGNPKTMLFYVALVPTLIPLEAIGAKDYAALVGITFVMLLAVLVPYILLASQARTLLKKPNSLKTLNRSAATVLAGTAAYIAARA